jgi:tetratricopeptide (TPR) repeat protein
MYYTDPLVGPGLDFDVPWRRFGFGRDRAKAARLYQSVIEHDSMQFQYSLSLGLIYQSRRDFHRAESVYRAIVGKAPASPLAQMHLFESFFAQGKWVAADSIMRLTQQMFPQSPVSATTAATMIYWRGDFSRFGQFLEAGTSGSPTVRRLALVAIADFSLMQGKLREFQRYRQEAADMGSMFGLASPLIDSVLMAFVDAEFRRKPEDATRRLEAALRLGASLHPRDREYISIAEGFARAGKPGRARAVVQLHELLLQDTVVRRIERPLIDQVAGEIALAEGKPREAMEYFRRADVIPDGPVTDCSPCLPLYLARSYDAANVTDSAIILFEGYLATPHSTRGWEVKLDPLNLAHTYDRLARLYEIKHDKKKAVLYYKKFLDLWKSADAELAPRIADAQRHLSSLQSGVGGLTM